MVSVHEYHRDSPERKAIRTGDLILFRDAAPFHDQLIELGTHSRYVHSALAYVKGDRVHIVQAIKGAGVSEAYLSDTLDTFEGAIEHWRVVPGVHERWHPPAALEFALAQLGKAFNYLAMGSFALDSIFGWLFPKNRLRSHSRSLKTFFCSQLVAASVKRGGVTLNPGQPFAATAPNDLIAHGKAELMSALATKYVLKKYGCAGEQDAVAVAV